MRPLQRTYAGVQLIEIIVAAAIFFVVAAVFLNLLPATRWAAKKSDNRLAALTIASNKIERARQARFEDLATLDSSGETQRINGTEFRISTTVGDVADSDPQLLKQYRIVIEWREAKIDKRTELTSYISRIKR